MRIVSVNTNGLRSAARKGFFDWLEVSGADVVCVQETKAQAADLDDSFRPAGWHVHFHSALKKGYAGTAIYARQAPDAVIDSLALPEFDDEGRYLEYRFGPLSVASLYLPSGSSGPERQASKDRFLDAYLPQMAAMRAGGREYVLCGDWNIAHREIDLKNWKSNQKNSGFLPHERAWMDQVLAQGWVDAYRHLYPEAEGEAYTWWSNRGNAYANNVGWRIDYQIVTPGMAARLTAGTVYKDQRFSDHAPLILDYAD
ncbi:exodeoxyribonuclease III [Flagellatimonas centrodinii]|uniref:exodeoxyribonuclease III n=1 Tax=Flagellatimonas centrodinii TaxID=2806210 RepID=UPI001FED7D91|nr:exodeoxyribonuclease III [Flagellatimonas centrodinii]ULQ47682.1 exodeoxyribonuclease III [Flagellatimonas centrodinii]